MAQPTQNDPQFKLRMPSELKDKVESAAGASNRSMNAEIVSRLEDSFNGEGKKIEDLKEAVDLYKAEVVMHLNLSRKYSDLVESQDQHIKQQSKIISDLKEQISNYRHFISSIDHLFDNIGSKKKPLIASFDEMHPHKSKAE